MTRFDLSQLTDAKWTFSTRRVDRAVVAAGDTAFDVVFPGHFDQPLLMIVSFTQIDTKANVTCAIKILPSVSYPWCQRTVAAREGLAEPVSRLRAVKSSFIPRQ